MMDGGADEAGDAGPGDEDGGGPATATYRVVHAAPGLDELVLWIDDDHVLMGVDPRRLGPVPRLDETRIVAPQGSTVYAMFGDRAPDASAGWRRSWRVSRRDVGRSFTVFLPESDERHAVVLPALALRLAGGVEPTGAHLENLVLADLVAWRDASIVDRPELFFWRTTAGEEVDFVLERRGELVAVEVTSTRRPRASDARHLSAFRDEYGPAVRGCLLLHDGDQVERLGRGIVAAPWWRVV